MNKLDEKIKDALISGHLDKAILATIDYLDRKSGGNGAELKYIMKIIKRHGVVLPRSRACIGRLKNEGRICEIRPKIFKAVMAVFGTLFT